MSKIRKIKYLIHSKFCNHEWEGIEEIKFDNVKPKIVHNARCKKCGMWLDEYRSKNK